MDINSALLIDFYKAVHQDMLPKNMTRSVSYFIPRYSRVKRWDKVVMFGLQGFIWDYLIYHFNINFFEKPIDLIAESYEETISNGFEHDNFTMDKIYKLHRLGYLPIGINAISEGELVPIGVPMFEVYNTHKDFAWLPQALESLMSVELWHGMISATVGHEYRKIVNTYYDKTADDFVPRHKALMDMSFRGQESLQSAIKSSSAWALSFSNSSTVPAIQYLEENYYADKSINGTVSTEHSVMCSNFAVDGDEETFLNKLLTELYPNENFTAVLDSYDYWNVIYNILPKLKDKILNRNAVMGIRGDSGDCVEVVTKTVFALWEIFGGSINSKGYKVLHPSVKAVYGDSITIERCEKIYQILEQNGFACNNVSLGVGSFSMQCIEEDGKLYPFTRDTFSFAIKATYGEIDGKPIDIFKNPKCNEGESFKKSNKGCIIVKKNNDGEYIAEDNKMWIERFDYKNCLEQVFLDGKITSQSLDTIRNRLNKGGF